MKLLFTGDIVLSEKCKKGKKLLSDLLQNRIREENVSIVCGNLEAPIVSSGEKKTKVGPNLSNSIETISLIADAGFNLVTLANNHISDYGSEGIKNTIQILNNFGIDYIGAGLTTTEAYRPFLIEEDHVKVAILNLAENGFGCLADKEDEYGYAYIYYSGIKEKIGLLKEEGYTVIMVCHAGAELWDFPLPEWRECYKKLLRYGADTVVAHHPHVPQGFEIYNGKPIFYSLGNFAFDLGKGYLNPESICVLLSIEKQGGVTFEIIPTVYKGIVDINESQQFKEHLSNCCDLLKNEKKYINEVEKKCKEVYDYYKNCYGKITCNYYGNFKERLKGIIKKYILRIKFQDIWLFHNIIIETHLYICRRAVKLKLKEKHII